MLSTREQFSLYFSGLLPFCKIPRRMLAVPFARMLNFPVFYSRQLFLLLAFDVLFDLEHLHHQLALAMCSSFLNCSVVMNNLAACYCWRVPIIQLSCALVLRCPITIPISVILW